MANLQYIGARYVPKFYENPDTGDNEWKSGVAYEPLTVVTYGGNSYTSKIPVAGTVGNPAANPAFWAKTGDYNASITALQNEVAQLQSDVVATVNSVKASMPYKENVIVKKYGYLQTLAGDSDTYSMQGGAYNPARDSFVCVLLNRTDNTTAKLIEVDAGDCITVLNRATVNQSDIGHGNSMTFNPNTNKFYIACAYSGVNIPNKLRVYNADLTFDSEISLSPAIAPTSSDAAWHISYDDVSNKYIARTESLMQIYDDAFTLVDSIAFAREDTITKGLSASGSVNACACAYNGLYFVQTYIEIGSQYADKVIGIYNLAGECIGSFNLSTDYVGDESEFMYVRNDVLYVAGQGAFYTIKQIVPATLNGSDFGRNYYNGAIPLNGTENVDDIIIVGKYNVNNSTIATALGMPYSSGGILEVKQVYGNRIEQHFIGRLSSGEEIHFSRQFNAGAWTSWHNDSSFFVAGDSITAAGIFLAFSVSATEIDVFIPMKDTTHISAASISAGTVFARADQEKINTTGSGSSFTYSDVDSVAITKSKVGIQLKLTRNTGWYLGANALDALRTIYFSTTGITINFT